jgi:hypothetical protein
MHQLNSKSAPEIGSINLPKSFLCEQHYESVVWDKLTHFIVSWTNTLAYYGACTLRVCNVFIVLDTDSIVFV